MRVPCQERVATISLCILVVISIVSKLLNGGERDGDKKTYTHARNLINQAVRWSAMATQDANPLFAMRHINYANAYFSAARSMVSDAGLEQATGRDIHQLANNLSRTQQKTMGMMGKTCPKSLPKGTTVTHWLD
jgi:hypothetical protein